MLRTYTVFLLTVSSAVLSACGGGGGGGSGGSGPTVTPPAGLAIGPAACIAGNAADFSCSGITLQKRLPHLDMGGASGNDLWGWADPVTAREYALVGQTSGTAFVDVTDAPNPVYLGRLDTATSASTWRDVKVFDDHAYIVADNAGSHGMQVFDLRRLRGVSSPQAFSVDALYSGFTGAHNIAINEASGFAYAVGTDTCNGGLHIVDIRSPQNPQFAGCHSASDTHDTQCVVYQGTDASFVGREICFSSNEDHIEIVDISDKAAPTTISTAQYPEVGFTHQAWLTRDHRFLLVGDELDESQFNAATRTLVFNVEELSNPSLQFVYSGPTGAIDHNLYVLGNHVFEANYTSGLRVLRFGDLAAQELQEVGYFDTFPANDALGFEGAWSVFPYLPSGNIIVNDTSNGLFVLGLEMLVASAGADRTALERESLVLEGFVSQPAATIAWTQTRGTPATLTNAESARPTLALPELAASETLTFELSVSNGLQETSRDFVNIEVEALPELADLSLPDPVLQQCLIDAASATGSTDIGVITVLDCAGVSSIDGLPALPGATDVVLTGNMLPSALAFLDWPSLATLDLRGNEALPCAELDQLELAFGSGLLAEDNCLRPSVIDLVADGFDVAVDEARRQIYVSLPDSSEVAVVSMTEARIVDRILLPGSPRGIDLGLDGARLFAALFGSNTVAVIDLATRSVETFPLLDQSGDGRLWDVSEVGTDRLFVTSNPSSNGFAYVVQIDLAAGNSLSRVASGQIIRAAPVIERSQDGAFAYIGEGFSPNSLYRLNLSDPTAPVVLEDSHGSVNGTNQLAINAAGSRIALGSGQVLRTGSFIEEGAVAAGANAASAVSNALFVNVADGVINVYDFDTLTQTETRTICGLGGLASRMEIFDGDRGSLLLRENQLCFTAVSARDPVPDPFAELVFPDAALESCIRDAAQMQAISLPEEFTSLDCSTSALKIRNIDGLDALTNLNSLDLSGSEILDLSALGSLGALTSLSLRDSTVADLGALAMLPVLATLDVTGSGAVGCDALAGLAGSGVAVSADFCQEHARIELGAIGFDLATDLVNDRAYVSVPAANEIVEIDLTTFSETRRFAMTAPPRGIDLSGDAATLYAALDTVGSIAYIDLATAAQQTIDILIPLNHISTYDVAEVSTDRIVVSASPGSGGFAYIVEIRRDLGNATQRVASDRIIRAGPFFAVSPDGTAVYVGEGFSPNSIYKLDATQALLPIVAEDDHGTVNGTWHLSVSADGSRLFTGSGQILETTAISQAGSVPAGLTVADPAGSVIYVAEPGSDTIGLYDEGSLFRVGERTSPCSLTSVERIEPVANGILLLGDDLLCLSRTAAYP